MLDKTLDELTRDYGLEMAPGLPAWAHLDAGTAANEGLDGVATKYLPNRPAHAGG